MLDTLPKKQPSFLLLQGLATHFFGVLADKLIAEGAKVHRVNYCAGDVWFGRKSKADSTNFRGTHDQLAQTYKSLIALHEVTTIICLGDCRPIHKIALKVAEELGIAVFVFEDGYIRPGWITLERNGNNDKSPLPRNAEGIRLQAGSSDNIPRTDMPPLPNPMPPRVKMDLVHHFVNLTNWFRFPHFKTHRPSKVSDEFKGWASRFWRKHKFHAENDALIKLYETTKERFFLVPLQLTSDFQIREHSDYDGVPDFIAEVLKSFAGHGNKNDRLLFKCHPLDNGMIDYRALIGTSTAIHRISDRVSYIEGGDLDQLLDSAAGIVLINSTVGFAAIKNHKPLKVMGRALYDMEGLTHTGALDSFWKKPAKPDISLVEDFLKVVRRDSQIYGDLFTDIGIELSATEATKRLMAASTPANRAKAESEQHA